ncbi:hypothetical protein [Streptomyces sp. XH2]|uniref:hypothetical protein n=1 Tax=Streptomyces sp. XH2 TaxID=3412483 RepID=UPI003C7A6CBC
MSATGAGREFAALWDADLPPGHGCCCGTSTGTTGRPGRSPGSWPAGPCRRKKWPPHSTRPAGQTRRGIYLVEWLVIALVVHRDKRLYISLPEHQTPGPAGSSGTQGGGARQGSPGAGRRGAGATNAGGMLITGPSMDRLRELPDEQYAEILHGLARSIRALNHALRTDDGEQNVRQYGQSGDIPV